MAVIFRKKQNVQEPVVEVIPTVMTGGSVSELIAKKEYETYLKEVAAERPVATVQQIQETKFVETRPHTHDEYGHDVFLIDKKEHLSKRSQYLNDILSFENK